jgi:SAM-dependent methyltransferase
MNSAVRQAGLVVALTALAGLGLVFWVTTYEAGEQSVSVKYEPPVVLADPLERDPNEPFNPTVGQPGKDVVWVPTSDAVVEAMLNLADVSSDDYLIDLGSGDGRTVIAAAKRGATALGVEFNPDMVELSVQRAAEAGVSDRATFMQGDLFETDLSEATVISMFLLPSINLELRPKLLELAPGTRIVSNSFDMGEWQPDAEERVQDEACRSWCTALFWVVPGNVDGTWSLPDGTLVLAQTFQQVSGILADNPLEYAELRGSRLTFTAGGRAYDATVEGGTLTATNGSWMARRAPRPQ